MKRATWRRRIGTLAISKSHSTFSACCPRGRVGKRPLCYQWQTALYGLKRTKISFWRDWSTLVAIRCGVYWLAVIEAPSNCFVEIDTDADSCKCVARLSPTQCGKTAGRNSSGDFLRLADAI